ncbi:M48 family metallopeptidase [Sandaracinus amylolyticus]|uniref:M48 family metallopeptidase n=1 Tax=Sandaracinus amylolyticus TaxID=927083 RepID=UPI00146FE8EA|nr:M48 family metallopeptidase [Sandaracinus amylolyticus]
MDERLYPAPPPRLPPGYLGSSFSYRAQALGVLLAMGTFVAVYVALLACTVGALRWVVVHVPPRDLPIFLFLFWVGAIVALGLVLLFLLKGLLVRQARARDEWIELLPAREPVLFAFLARLAKEVGAPVPRRVYVAPDVNAAVFQDTTLLSLVLPSRKQLVIGLGLINSLDLRELKAVLAHELGHFSQRSMRLGSYVYFGQQILVQLVAGRDAVDVAIDQLRFASRRELSLVGWTAYGLVASMRAVLATTYRLVTLADRALSREMELHADRVAIAAAGSDATVRLLGRVAYGQACLDHAMSELAHAGDHALFTTDLYAHQLRAAETLPDEAFRAEWARLDAPLGPDLPPLFPPGADDARPSMWATHPPNAAREDAARAPWIDAARSAGDETSAWALFADPDGLRQRMTMQLFRRMHPGRTLRFSDPTTVERFLVEERESAKLDERHRGAYGQRLIALLPLDEIFARASASAMSADAVERARIELYGPDHTRAVARAEAILRELESLSRALAHAEQEGRSSVTVRGFERPLEEVRDVAMPLEAELEALGSARDAWDRRVAEVHARMAADLGPDATNELRARYAFHLAIQDLRRGLHRAAALLHPAIEAAGVQVALAPHVQEHAMRLALDARGVVAEVLAHAGTLTPPALPGLAADRGGAQPERLARVLLPEPLISDPRLMEARVSREVIERLARQHGEVLDRLERVRRKSLAGLVASQDAIAARWSSARRTSA